MIFVSIRAAKNHRVSGRPANGNRLVRSTNNGGNVRQETLLGLGTDFPSPVPSGPMSHV